MRGSEFDKEELLKTKDYEISFYDKNKNKIFGNLGENIDFTKKIIDTKNSFILVDDSVIALRNAKKAGLVTVGIYDENSKDTFPYIKAENPYSIKKLTELKDI